MGVRETGRRGTVRQAEARARGAGPARRDVQAPSALPHRVSAGWRGALREVAVIAAGALAALGGQAWWQDREDRGRERDYLRQLLVDTRENERRLDRAVAADSTTRRELACLVRTLYTPGPLPPPDTLLVWLGGSTFSASDPQPVTGTYTALVSTGDLRLIRTDTLRTLLIAYAATLESRRGSLDFYRQQAFGDPGRIVRAMPFLIVTFFDGAGAVRMSSIDFARLRRDPELAGVLFALQVANGNRFGILRDLRGETRRLRRALEAEHVDGAPVR